MSISSVPGSRSPRSRRRPIDVICIDRLWEQPRRRQPPRAGNGDVCGYGGLSKLPDAEGVRISPAAPGEPPGPLDVGPTFQQAHVLLEAAVEVRVERAVHEQIPDASPPQIGD